MPLSQQKEEELRKEFAQWYIDSKKNPQPETIRDYFISKLSSLIQEERERILKGVEQTEKIQIPHEDHECHMGCCGSCWCEKEYNLVNLSDVLKIISDQP